MSPELRNVADLALFARVVEIGSITRCAANLGFERSTVSRRISALEAQLGVRLLERSTTNVSVTKAGRRCYEQCAGILRAAQDAQSAALNNGTGTPVPPLRVGASISVVESILNTALDDFRIHNRSAEIELKLIDDWTEENIESVDVGLALGPVRTRNAWTKRVARVRQVLCASPQYIALSGELSDVDELATWPGIVDEATMPAATWTFTHGDSHFRCRVCVRHALPTLLEVRQAVIAGLGIACLPLFMCEEQLRAGQLTALLPDLEPLPRDLLLLSPKSAMPKRGPTALRLSLESALEGKAL